MGPRSNTATDSTICSTSRWHDGGATPRVGGHVSLPSRVWVHANLAPREPNSPIAMTYGEARALQSRIFDAGFAGVAVPAIYGGCGLTLEHQKVWAEEVKGYQVPAPLFVSIGILGMTLLDHGSDDLKSEHLPKILRGDEVWIQLLSEPSGGSDMGAVMTRATRDGDSWVLNGGKIWTTHADKADYGMCLARTDWDQTKYRGLSMFAVPFSAPGVTVEPIVGQEGGAHFCQEFFDDVALPAGNLVGDENHGWRVAHTLLEHEHDATAGVGHGLGLGGGGERNTETETGVGDLVEFARRGGQWGPALPGSFSPRRISTTSSWARSTAASSPAAPAASSRATGAHYSNWDWRCRRCAVAR